jgi:ElaB/YqjD/DUF883 family membrane-anchored ribosome-binding protein
VANTMNEASQQETLAEQAQSKVQEATSTAQEKASELREQGSRRLRAQFDQRSTQAGSQVRSLAEALRRSGNDLQSEGAAELPKQAAERLERLGSYLEEVSGDDVMRDIESFARRRPWMLTGLGLVAGVAAARFLKASSDQRYSEYRRTTQYGHSTSELPAASASEVRIEAPPETTMQTPPARS